MQLHFLCLQTSSPGQFVWLELAAAALGLVATGLLLAVGVKVCGLGFAAAVQVHSVATALKHTLAACTQAASLLQLQPGSFAQSS
jgi:hypothetical protein